MNLHIAMTYAQHDADHAVDLATAALAIPAEQRIGPIGERVHQLRKMLPEGCSAVGDFDQLIAASSARSSIDAPGPHVRP